MSFMQNIPGLNVLFRDQQGNPAQNQPGLNPNNNNPMNNSINNNNAMQNTSANPMQNTSMGGITNGGIGMPNNMNQSVNANGMIVAQYWTNDGDGKNFEVPLPSDNSNNNNNNNSNINNNNNNNNSNNNNAFLIDWNSQYQVIQNSDGTYTLPTKQQTTVNVFAATWSRESHGLYDYEARHPIKKQFNVTWPTTIVRKQTDVTLQNAVPPQPQQDVEPLWRLILRNNKFCVDGWRGWERRGGKLWRVVKDLPTGYNLQEGDSIKLGRFKLKVRQIVASQKSKDWQGNEIICQEVPLL